MSLPKRLTPLLPSGQVQRSGALFDVGPDTRAEAFALAAPDSDRREDYAAAIAALWNRARDSFIAIGRALEQAKVRLPHGEFERMIEADLPFDKRTAHQIRVAATAVTSGRLPVAKLPSSYSTIYHLATLPSDAIQLAERQGLIRPNLRRSEVIAFKRGFSSKVAAEQEHLEAELSRLLRQREEIDSRIERVRSRLRGREGIQAEGALASPDKNRPTQLRPASREEGK